MLPHSNITNSMKMEEPMKEMLEVEELSTNGVDSQPSSSCSGVDSQPSSSSSGVDSQPSSSSSGVDSQPSSSSNGVDSQPSSSSQPEDSMTTSTSQSSEKFYVDTNLIPQAEGVLEGLVGLGLDVYNQEDLEQGIIAQVDKVLAKEEDQRIKRLLEIQLSNVLDDIRSSRDELEKIGRVIRSATGSNQGGISKEAKKQIEAANRQRENKLKQMKKLKAKREALLLKLDGKEIDSELAANDEDLQFFNQALSGDKVPVETEQERLIKLGEMTPFGTVMPAEKPVIPKSPPKPAAPSDFELFLQDKDTATVSNKGKSLKNKPFMNKKSSQLHNLLTNPRKSSFLSSNLGSSQSSSTSAKLNMFSNKDKESRPHEQFKKTLLGKKRKKVVKLGKPLDDNVKEDGWKPSRGSEEEWRPSGEEDDDEPIPRKKKKPSTPIDSGINEAELGTKAGKHRLEKSSSEARTRDDGNYAFYQKRLKTYHKLEAARKKKQHDERMSDSEDEEVEFEGGLKVPGTLWKKLFGYQRTGVKWLWELHCQQAGGIVGDEMGLGKTIQTIGFLASLKVSRLKQRPFRYVGLGPTIIVCPATMMHQWVREFHKWWPEFRVAVLHSSGSHTGSEENLIHNIVNQHGVIVTSYTTLVHQQDSLLQHDWHYIILDEGHKIRNPDAQITQACKQFRTPHRIILSGSPIQNNLKELWSLFDFIFPGKLGTLPDFMAHLSVPIVQGGYANASQVQVQTAYKCACILRDTINPYLLRRMKADVKSSVNLPGKSEQVLFCRLTDEQRDVYQEYLDSKECNAILTGKYKVFAGLITLRKICNHPDISTGGPRVLVGQSTDGDESLEYGYWRRSGKLIVVEALLKLWNQQGQRVLLFSQSKQMLDILESFVTTSGYSFLRMDGGTGISARQPLIQKFNNSPGIFLFLLTTRVGGLGVNLTGANRVVIFDPDWNPSTDLQARERAWRIGQNKQVTIYRLLTTGTIEEKIYHRQIFKQFLTNRVLKDPKQRRFFKTNDLFELFTLGTKDDQNGTETGAIFAGMGSEVKLDKNRNRFDEMKKEALPVGKKKTPQEVNSPKPDEKTQKLRELARKLSDKISQNAQSKEIPKKKKKKSKRSKDAVLEGEKIPHLAKLDEYQSGVKTDNEQLSARQDDYVLKRLFKKTGIQGALKHDVIVGADKIDYALVEGEAERVAREAAAALKRSRQHCSNALSGVPNWTGNSRGGQPARPRFGKKKNSLLAKPKPVELKTNGSTCTSEEKQSPSKAFDGSLAGNRSDVSLFSSSNQVVMSSSELLGRMRARQVVTDNADNQAPVATESQNGEDKDIELVTDIRNFIAFQCHIDGQASTQELLDEFGIKLPPGDSAKFKAMLRQICDFDCSGDAGLWRLKPEYR